MSEDQIHRMRRRGYLIDANGHPFKVPAELRDIYREQWPDLGADVLQLHGIVSEDEIREVEGLPPKPRRPDEEP